MLGNNSTPTPLSTGSGGGGGRHMIVFEKGGGARNTGMGSDHLYIRNITRVSPGVFRFHVKDDYVPRFQGVAVGNWVTYGFNKANLTAAEKAAKDESASIYAQIAADLANQEELYTGISGSFLREYASHAVRDYIVDLVQAVGLSAALKIVEAMAPAIENAIQNGGMLGAYCNALMVLTAVRFAFLLPLPGGLGTVEAAQVLTLRQLGFDPAVGLSASVLIRGRDVLLGLTGLWWGNHFLTGLITQSPCKAGTKKEVSDDVKP